jgi:hypothetical protein
MSDLATVAVNAAHSNPMDFVMGPMILPIFAIVFFTVMGIGWKVAGLIEAKLNK